MGRRPLNRVRCPRCNKVGTLRLKQGISIVISHYDSVKAKQRRGKGMRHHYIGSIRYDVDKILAPYENKLSEPNFVALKIVLKRLKTSLTQKPENYSVIEYDEQLSKVLLAVNELRAIKRIQGVVDRRVAWSMRCASCKQPHRIYVKFHGLNESGGIRAYFEKQ